MGNIKRFPFTAILGWSSTRYELFSICKRKYFYQYYAKYDHELTTKRIRQFKDLVSIPLEIGSIVHKVIEVMLTRLKTTTEPIDRDKFFDFALRRVDHKIQTSVFDEVIYGEKDEVSADDLYPKVHECLGNLLESDRYTWLVTEAVQKASGWIIDPPGYGETRIGDLKVYSKVDFLFPIGDAYHIIDWKTGKADPDRHRKQLVGYSTWAAYHFDTEPEKVNPTIAYLHPDYKEIRENFNAFDLENFAIQVRAETDEMYEYCRDVPNNIPLEKAEFARVDHERICGYCKFRGICFPDQYPVSF